MKQVLILILSLVFLLNAYTAQAQSNYAAFSLGYSPVFGSTHVSAYMGNSSFFDQSVNLRGQLDMNLFIPGISLSVGADALYQFPIEELTLYIGAGPDLMFIPGAEDIIFSYGVHLTAGAELALENVYLFAELQPGFFVIPNETASPSAGVRSSFKLGLGFPF